MDYLDKIIDYNSRDGVLERHLIFVNYAITVIIGLDLIGSQIQIMYALFVAVVISVLIALAWKEGPRNKAARLLGFTCLNMAIAGLLVL